MIYFLPIEFLLCTEFFFNTCHSPRTGPSTFSSCSSSFQTSNIPANIENRSTISNQLIHEQLLDANISNSHEDESKKSKCVLYHGYYLIGLPHLAFISSVSSAIIHSYSLDREIHVST